MDPVEHGDAPPPASPWRVEVGLAALGRIALVLLAVTVTTGILTRATWRNVVPDDVLLVAELMLVVTLSPLALITALREHISVDVFTNRAGPGVQRWLAVLGHLVGIGFFGVLAAAYGKLLADSWATGEIYESLLRLPQWPGHAVAVLCVATVVARLLALLYRDLTGRGGPDRHDWNEYI